MQAHAMRTNKQRERHHDLDELTQTRDTVVLTSILLLSATTKKGYAWITGIT